MAMGSAKVIGITGAIGSGKSLVGKIWATARDIPLIDADLVCRDLLEPGKPGWTDLKKEFGSTWLDKSGTVNRTLLRRAIMEDENIRKKLNSITHPLARKEVLRKINSLQSPLVLIEAALLFEAGWDDMFSAVVVVYADCSTCVSRVIKRDLATEKEAKRALAAQWPIIDKVRLAGHVVDNNGCPVNTWLQMIALMRLYNRSIQE